MLDLTKLVGAPVIDVHGDEIGTVKAVKSVPGEGFRVQIITDVQSPTFEELDARYAPSQN